jgi:hypothetical protein
MKNMEAEEYEKIFLYLSQPYTEVQEWARKGMQAFDNGQNVKRRT